MLQPWASIYDPTLPHGDPGCTVVLDSVPVLLVQGPIYFDETVTPKPYGQHQSMAEYCLAI
jgi:hypothetical protein